ncbi:MAG: cyclodeaminase/cyclohydrolase family protein [Candidatus Limnocylindria bacterium]
MDERIVDVPVRELVERLATSDPVPGGGSAAALTGAMAAALVHMVVDLSVGRPAAADHESELLEIGVASAQFQSELLALADADATAYASVVAARRLPHGTELEQEARRVQVAAAIRDAIRAPLAVASAASEVLALATRLPPIGSRNAISDVGVAALLSAAAVRGAMLNVEINLPSVVHDDALRAEAISAVERHGGDLAEREVKVQDAVSERMR